MSKKSWIPAYAGMTGKEGTGNVPSNRGFGGVCLRDLFYSDDGGWEGI
jgi:hypothetical protein